MSFSRPWFPESSSNEVRMPSTNIVSVRGPEAFDESCDDFEGTATEPCSTCRTATVPDIFEGYGEEYNRLGPQPYLLSSNVASPSQPSSPGFEMSGAAWPVSSDQGIIPTLYTQQSATHHIPFDLRGNIFDLSGFGSGLALNGEPVHKIFERGCDREDRSVHSVGTGGLSSPYRLGTLPSDQYSARAHQENVNADGPSQHSSSWALEPYPYDHRCLSSTAGNDPRLENSSWLTRNNEQAYPLGNGMNREPFDCTDPFDVLSSNQYPSPARLPTPETFESLAENSPGYSPGCLSSIMGFSATETSLHLDSAPRQKFPDPQSPLNIISPSNIITDPFLYASPTATLVSPASSIAASSWYASSPSPLRDEEAVFTHELRVESSPSTLVGVVGSESRAGFNNNRVSVVEDVDEHAQVKRERKRGVEAARIEVGSSNQVAPGRRATRPQPDIDLHTVRPGQRRLLPAPPTAPERVSVLDTRFTDQQMVGDGGIGRHAGAGVGAGVGGVDDRGMINGGRPQPTSQVEADVAVGTESSTRKCQFCRHNFSRPGNFYRHRLTSVGCLKCPKLYKCSGCSKSFTVKPSLRRHQKKTCGKGNKCGKHRTE